MGETIAAIATGMGDSGIGIIRISGDTALQIVNQVFQPVNKKKSIMNMESYTAAYGKIIYEGEIYDEADYIRIYDDFLEIVRAKS